MNGCPLGLSLVPGTNEKCPPIVPVSYRVGTRIVAAGGREGEGERGGGRRGGGGEDDAAAVFIDTT